MLGVRRVDRKARVFGSVVAALIAALGLVTAPSIRAAAAVPVAVNRLSRGANGETLDPPARLDELGSSGHGGIYGGLIVSRGGTHVKVYLTRPAAAVDHSFAAAAGGVTVSFVRTPHSLASLDIVQRRILAAAPAMRAAGVKIVEFGPDIATSREQVGVQDLTGAQAQTLTDRFGAGMLKLVNLTANQVPVPTIGRATDVAPWNAGDYIGNQDHSAGCSSGFGVSFGSGRVQGNFTAGHCFASGTGVYNYAVAEGHGSNTRMGFISNRDTKSGGTDTEILETAYHGGSSAVVWTGIPSSTTRSVVSNWSTNPVGDQICNSGAYSGRVCGATITNNNTCIYVDGVYKCHLIHAVNSAHAIANETGDSGGPVFRYIGSGLYGTGIVSASSTADERSCQYNTNQECFWDIYYTAMDSALSEYGAKINT